MNEGPVTKRLLFSASRAIAPPTLAPTPFVPTTETNPKVTAFSAGRALSTVAPGSDAPTDDKRPKFVFQALATRTISSRDGSRSVTFLGSHDVTKMPNPGKVRVEPQPLSSEDIERARALVDKGAPDSDHVLSMTRRYNDFRDKNPQILSHGVGVLGFCAQQTRSEGVGPGSGRNMAKALLGILREAGEKIEGCPLVNAMLLGLDREYAEKGAKPAVDISEDEALDFLARIKRADVRAALWLVLTCGARVADLLRLMEEQMTLDFVARRLRIEFRVTKNRTSVSDKYDVSFPFMSDPDDMVVDWLNGQRQLPNCDSINHVLKKANMKVVSGRSITTYSFRRVFEHRIIEWYTGDDGITEWAKVIAWTQHKDDKALKGHYNKVTMLKVPKPKGAAETVPPVPPMLDTFEATTLAPPPAPASGESPPSPSMVVPVETPTRAPLLAPERTTTSATKPAKRERSDEGVKVFRQTVFKESFLKK